VKDGFAAGALMHFRFHLDQTETNGSGAAVKAVGEPIFLAVIEDGHRGKVRAGTHVFDVSLHHVSVDVIARLSAAICTDGLNVERHHHAASPCFGPGHRSGRRSLRETAPPVTSSMRKT